MIAFFSPPSTFYSPLFLAYLAAGPGAWIIFSYLMIVGRERMNKLQKSSAELPTSPPLVSILIPAKDEGDHIRTCIERVMQQDYPAFEVIAINDRSIDNTGSVLDEFVGQGLPHIAKTFRVVHVTDLPAGWLGKCHALDIGGKHAKGEWLFFVDSDVKLQPDALSKMASIAIAREYDALSITTTIETEFFVERLMLPLLAATWATLFAADQTNEDSQPDRAIANGQVFLIRDSAYNKVGGHAAVKDRIVEDVELMRTLKKNGFKTRFFAGRHLASTRMHTHLKQMFNGWARIFAGSSRGRILPMIGAIAFLLACVTTSYAAIIYGIFAHNPWWYLTGIAHWLIMTIALGIVWTWTGNSPAYALLLPLSVPTEIAILIFSIRRAIRGKVEWRGVSIDVRQTSQLSTVKGKEPLS